MTDHRPSSRSSWSPLPGLFRSRTAEEGIPLSEAGPTVEEPSAASRQVPSTRQALEQRFAGQRTPEELIHAFADGLAGLEGELSDMGLRLQSACTELDWTRCGRLMRQLIDKYIRTIETDDPLANGRTSGERLRDLMVQLLDNLSVCLQPTTLIRQAEGLADELRQWQPGLALESLEHQLRLLDQELRQHAQAAVEQRQLMLAVFAQLLDNVAELISPDSWLYGELLRLRPLLDDPSDAAGLHEAFKGLREASYRQALLQENLAQANNAIGHALPELADQWSEFATTPAGADYVDRVRALPQALAAARNGAELLAVLHTLGQDTQRLQLQANESLMARDQARGELIQALEQIQSLEHRLAQPSSQAALDALTGLPSATQLERLLLDAVTANPSLNVGMLAINGLAHCHRQHGRRAAQRLQQALAESLAGHLHDDEILVRLPEGLFVVLMPGASLLAAHDRLLSLQRLMTQDGAPACRGAVMRWGDEASCDRQLDRLEAAIPTDDGTTALELV